MILAKINKIIPFSNVDGPGNRMAIFFQGCQFRCLYCHNPETINKCNNCGICVGGCPVGALSISAGKVIFDKDLCIECDQCTDVCPYLSTPKMQTWRLDELIAYIKKYQPFISGITVSGGECMMQADFLLPLFKEVKAMGLGALIDSNGSEDFSMYRELLDVSDGVMLDVKAWDNLFHKRITSLDNEMVKKNLTYLSEIDKLYEVRTVILPHHSEMNHMTVSEVARRLSKHSRYKLIQYRPYGVRQAGLEFFDNDINLTNEVQELSKYLSELGYENIIIK